MKLLLLYQKVKPGVLTESGFNICKLLFKESFNGDQENAAHALDVLLIENKDDTRLWLEKARLFSFFILFYYKTERI